MSNVHHTESQLHYKKLQDKKKKKKITNLLFCKYRIIVGGSIGVLALLSNLYIALAELSDRQKPEQEVIQSSIR